MTDEKLDRIVALLEKLLSAQQQTVTLPSHAPYTPPYIPPPTPPSYVRSYTVLCSRCGAFVTGSHLCNETTAGRREPA